MSGALVLGIDLGTSSCKACLVDGDGRVAARGRASYETHVPHAGWTEQDPRDWLRAVATATREALAAVGARRRAVAAVGLSSAAHIAVLIDAANEPVRRAILWSDQRSVDEVRALEQAIGATIYSQTRNKASTTWTLPHLAWIRRNDPGAWARVKRVALSKDYLLWWLTGRWATDAATAVSSMLFDAGQGCWSRELCAAAGLSADALPDLVGTAEVAGHLTDAAAAGLELAAGLPVVAGSLDSATELYAAGVFCPGDALIRLATAGGIEVVSAEPRPHPRLISYPHPVRPLWYNQAGTSSCGSAVDWVARLIGGVRSPLPYADFDRLAEAAPAGAGGVVFHPYLAGERCPHWDPALRGSFVGLGLTHGPGHIARASLEGVSLSIRDALSALPAAIAGDAPLKVVGGGAASGIWLQILASVLRRPVVPVREADSSLGAALLALSGVAGGGSPAAGRRDEQGRAPIAPRQEWAAVYERVFADYRLIHRQMREVYDRAGGGAERVEGGRL